MQKHMNADESVKKLALVMVHRTHYTGIYEILA
jgi:hypothetical protein